MTVHVTLPAQQVIPHFASAPAPSQPVWQLSFVLRQAAGSAAGSRVQQAACLMLISDLRERRLSHLSLQVRSQRLDNVHSVLGTSLAAGDL